MWSLGVAFCLLGVIRISLCLSEGKFIVFNKYYKVYLKILELEKDRKDIVKLVNIFIILVVRG